MRQKCHHKLEDFGMYEFCGFVGSMAFLGSLGFLIYMIYGYIKLYRSQFSWKAKHEGIYANKKRKYCLVKTVIIDD